MDKNQSDNDSDARIAGSPFQICVWKGMRVQFNKQRDSIFPLSFEQREDLRVMIINDLHDLEKHATAWNDLALQTPESLPDSSHAWISSYFEHQLEKGESWFCMLAYDGTRLVGVLPLTIKFISILKLNRIVLQTPYNKHTSSVDFLAEQGRELEIFTYFIQILKWIKPDVIRISFRRLREKSVLLKLAKSKTKGAVFEYAIDSYGSYVKVNGCFEDYIGTLSPKFIKNLKRLERKLEDLGDIETKFLEDEHSLEESFSCFLKLEDACWKGTLGTSIIKNSNQVAFYNKLIIQLSSAGWLEWHFLFANQKAIAGHFAVRFGRALIIYKIGFDESFSSYSPGTKLFEKMLQRAFDSGEIDEVDCLSDAPWNKNWRMEKRAYYNLHIIPGRPVSLIIHYLPLIIRKTGYFISGFPGFFGFFKQKVENYLKS